MHLTLCYCPVTYAFQSKSTLYTCMNATKLLPRCRREIWNLSDCNWTRTHNHFFPKRTLNHLAKLAKWLNGVMSTYLYVDLTVCFFHVTYTFQSESILYSCLNVKELLLRSKREIWSLSDCNWTRTQNHLILKRTLNHLVELAKWLNCVLSTYLYCAFDCTLFRVNPHSIVCWMSRKSFLEAGANSEV